MTSEPRQRRLVIGSSCAGILVGAMAYLSLLFDFGFNPGRSAISLGYASNFFDLQARALMRGHLDVPAGSLGIEGFVLRGHTYMYFPPFPALIRIPLLAVSKELDGHLTVASMLAAWVVFAVMTGRLTWLVRDCLRPGLPVTRGEGLAAAAFLAAATGGTVLTFDAALPWVYHEVYAWSIALVLTGAYWLIRIAREPRTPSCVWLLLTTTAAVLTRTPGGFGLAAATVVLAAVLGWRQLSAGRVLKVLALSGILPIVISCSLNYLKFRHLVLFPLEDQVWTSVNSHRRQALLVNGGTITGPQFLTTTLTAYLRPDGIRFVSYFPWVTLPAGPAPALAGAFLDQSYRTGSITAFMPLLSLLTLGAGLVLARPRRPAAERALVPAVFACALACGPVLAYGYVAHRYTSEFVPVLVVGGAVGLWGAARLLAGRRRLLTVLGGSAMVLLTSFSLVAQLLTGYTSIATTHRGDALGEYVLAQLAHGGGTGSALTARITRSDSLPRGGRADDLHIRGSCDALYLNTGDAYEPWVLVEQRGRVFELSGGERLRPGHFPLLLISGNTTREISVDVGADRSMRLVVEDSQGHIDGPWLPLYRGLPVRVGVAIRTDLGYAEVTSTPGGHLAYVPWLRWDADWVAGPGDIVVAPEAASAGERLGLAVTETQARPASVCDRVAAVGG